ncbi:hypothetical protein MAPG_11841, partial [Magnaporthiopsis poae ATCC 64411]
MDDLFTPVSQVYTTRTQETLLEANIPQAKPEPVRTPVLSSYADALEVLKREPNYETLSSVLEYLINGIPSDGKVMNIHSPSPQNSQIIQTLVTEVAPNYWRLLKDEAENALAAEGNPGSPPTPYYLLLACLRNLSGVNAILTHLRGLIGGLEASADDGRRSHTALTLELLMDLLCSLLAGPETILQIWENTTGGLEGSSAMARPLAQELVNVLAGGRVVSVAAEAERTIKKKDDTDAEFWVAASKDYSLWLLQNIIYWARKGSPESQSKVITELLVKAFRLGHSDLMVQVLVETLLVRESDDGKHVFDRLCKGLPHFEQRRLLYSLLKFASRAYFDGAADLPASEPETSTVAAVAGLLNSAVLQVESRVNLLLSWLTDSSGAAPGESVGIRRAVIAVVAQKKDDITTVVEKSLDQFGDQLYVRHAPLLQQEAHAQVLLLSAGYLHRANPIKLALLAKSSAYMNAISNRLGAPQTRARVLGMIVGEALSTLAKTGGKGLDFDMNETKSDDAKWYKALVEISDSIGPVDSLRKKVKTHNRPDVAKKAAKAQQKPRRQAKQSLPTPATQPKKPAIVEVVDSDEEEDDLVPYAKPDSDPEDSEDDAELVRRDKPRA